MGEVVGAAGDIVDEAIGDGRFSEVIRGQGRGDVEEAVFDKGVVGRSGGHFEFAVARKEVSFEARMDREEEMYPKPLMSTSLKKVPLGPKTPSSESKFSSMTTQRLPLMSGTSYQPV